MREALGCRGQNPPVASLLMIGPWSNYPSAHRLPKLAMSFRQKRTRRGTFGPLRGLERSPTGRLTSRLSCPGQQPTSATHRVPAVCVGFRECRRGQGMVVRPNSQTRSSFKNRVLKLSVPRTKLPQFWLTESNRFIWLGPDVRRIDGETTYFVALPPILFGEVRRTAVGALAEYPARGTEVGEIGFRPPRPLQGVQVRRAGRLLRQGRVFPTPQ